MVRAFGLHLHAKKINRMKIIEMPELKANTNKYKNRCKNKNKEKYQIRVFMFLYIQNKKENKKKNNFTPFMLFVFRLQTNKWKTREQPPHSMHTHTGTHTRTSIILTEEDS